MIIVKAHKRKGRIVKSHARKSRGGMRAGYNDPYMHSPSHVSSSIHKQMHADSPSEYRRWAKEGQSGSFSHKHGVHPITGK